MQNKKLLSYLFLFFINFFSLTVFASDDWYDLQPTNGLVPDFCELCENPVLGKLCNVGTIHLDNEMHPILVKMKISKKNNGAYWDLYFSHPLRPNKKKPNFAILHFFVHNGEASFKGLLIDEKYRVQGLSKVMFKFFVAYALHNKQRIVSEKMYKPLFGKLLQDLCMEPASADHIVAICKQRDKTDSTVHIYPYGFNFKQALMKSQKMKLVDKEPDADACQKVAVYTSYGVPEDHEAFLRKIEAIPGEYALYVPAMSEDE